MHFRKELRLVSLVVIAALWCAACALRGAAETRGGSSLSPTLILPGKVVAGQPATIAVLDAGGHLAGGSTVEISGVGRETADVTGRVTFTAPGNASFLTVRTSDGNAEGRLRVVPGGGLMVPSASIAGLSQAGNFLAVGDPLEIEGAGFDGHADQDHVFVGSEPVMVLAASPVSLITLAGSNCALGETRISLTVGGRVFGLWPATLVSLTLAGPSNPFSEGSSAQFVVHVTGSEKPILVQLSNATPDVIDLAGGVHRRLLTSGGVSNAVSLEATSLHPGAYAVSVSLVQTSPGGADEEIARSELMTARAVADAAWRKRIDSLLTLIKRRPEEPSRVRREIGKQLREHPPERIQDSLRVVNALMRT